MSDKNPLNRPQPQQKQVHWRDKPVRNIEQAVGRSLLRNKDRRVNSMALAFVNALKNPARDV